jgi:hypothetical protein
LLAVTVVSKIKNELDPAVFFGTEMESREVRFVG